MPASDVPRPTPISKLHDDVLWSIFLFNSHMICYRFNGDSILNVLGGSFGGKTPEIALLTNRRTSQVCRRWRDVIIASPSIWANAIDLKYLNQRGDEWRNEVLKRTGDAPLSVIGASYATIFETPEYSAFVLPFLLKILDAEWHRIRTLVIYSYDRAIDDQLRVSVLRSAPHLQNLIFSLYKYDSGRKPLLFSNHAPCLQSLNAQGLSVDFSVSSWSYNLRSLNLALGLLDIAIPDFLRSLEGMPCLENLRLRSVRSWDHPHLEQNPSTLAASPFIFRNLERITISDCQYAIPELISRIIVPPGCVLDIIDGTYTEEIDAIGISQDSTYWSCYTSYIKNNVASITDLSFSIIYYPFENSDDEFEDDDSEHEDGYSCFSVSLSGPQGQCFRFQSPSMGVSPIAFRLARAISLCDLTKVTTLNLHLKPAEMTDIVEDEAFDDLVALISEFYSVKTLHTDDDTLKLFMDTEDLVVNASRDEKVLFTNNVVTIFTDAWESGIVGFLGLGGGAEGLSVSRIVFNEDSTVPCGDPTVLREAAKMGITVGWKGVDRRFKITFTDDGVLEFAPKF